MERAGAHPCDTERREPRAELAAGLVGEGDRRDLRRLERARGDLAGDAPCDRRRLPGAGAGEDADGAAHGLCRTSLAVVQAVERVHRATVAAGAAGKRAGSVTALVPSDVATQKDEIPGEQ